MRLRLRRALLVTFLVAGLVMTGSGGAWTPMGAPWSGSGTARAAGLLGLGSTGTDVVYLQEKLAAAGFDPGPADGVFGPRTLAAVQLFQRARGLVPDGWVGPLTWRAIEEGVHTSRVVGYYYGPGAAESLWTYGECLTDVADFGFRVKATGEVTGEPAPDVLWFAEKNGTGTWAVVTNEGMTGFDGRLAHALLSSPAARQRAVEEMARLCRANGYQGIVLDFEGVVPDDRGPLSSFAEQLAQKLHAQGLALGLAVPAKTADDSPEWNGAYDYRALGRVADWIAPMAYDYHWSGSTPGPVAPLSWVREVATYAATAVGAKKVLLGLAAYGYDWVAGTSRGVAVPAYRARSLAYQQGVSHYWDDAGQVPYYLYSRSGTRRVVFYENEYSLAGKLNVVDELGLGGITIWRLGLEVPEVWPLIGERLGGRR